MSEAKLGGRGDAGVDAGESYSWAGNMIVVSDWVLTVTPGHDSFLSDPREFQALFRPLPSLKITVAFGWLLTNQLFSLFLASPFVSCWICCDGLTLHR